MNAIVEVLMKRDGMTKKEAEQELEQAREEFDANCDDFEEFMADRFGLEPDYIFDFFE
ncbi:MAG: hypothetical protein BACD_00150 [Bacteroides rodentium]